MKILITGGTGFVGSHLIPKLKKHKHHILNFTRSATKNSESITVDYSDKKCIENALDLFQPEIIIHLASDKNRSKALENDTKNISELLKNEKKFADSLVKCKQLKLLINFGTSDSFKTYKQMNHNDVINSYGYRKSKSDEMLSLKCDEINISYINVVPSVIYGPGQGNEMLIPYIIDCLSLGKKCFIKNPLMKSNFIHVDDVVKAILNILKFDNYKNLPKRVFLDYKKNYLVEDVVRILVKKTNASFDLVELNTDSKNLTEHKIRSHMNERLIWSASISLSEGLEKILKNA